MTTALLAGVRIVTIALNLPGPAAARRLAGLGATVVKVEPPAGDPMAAYHPDWYAMLARGQEARRIDLKDPAGRVALGGLLQNADVLLTSSRPSALARLGLDWPGLSARHPRLVQVAITGYPAPDIERSGHDLTYLASVGLLSPPTMPLTLIADLAGAERAVAAVLAMLYARERSGTAGYMEVSLGQVAHDLAEPLRMGVTKPGAVLGGGFPGYALYRASDGWVAIAALEPHFLAALEREVGTTSDVMAAAFVKQTVRHWEARGRELDIPMVGVRGER